MVRQLIGSQSLDHYFISAMERALRNVPPKRVFGRDITNLDQKRPKNASISEKPALAPSARHKSHSVDRRTLPDAREPIGEYQAEILGFMVSRQRKQSLELTAHVTAEMRQVLVDWLVDVHLSFELREQTLFLALAYLNAYAAVHEISKHEYQLVGVTCLWIASKYEEIYPPRMRNYVEVTDSSYSVAELKAMEGRILLALHFNLTLTTPLHLLEALADRWPKEARKLTREGAKTLALCKYLLELSLFEGLGKHYCGKTLVLTALMLADSILKTKSDTRALEGERVEKETLMTCFKDMCSAMQNTARPNSKHRAIRKKYSHERYLEVAKFRIEPK